MSSSCLTYFTPQVTGGGGGGIMPECPLFTSPDISSITWEFTVSNSLIRLEYLSSPSSSSRSEARITSFSTVEFGEISLRSPLAEIERSLRVFRNFPASTLEWSRAARGALFQKV